MDVVIINPSFLIGPYDQKPGSNRLVLMGTKRKVIFHPPGGKNFVHVTDVAISIVSALKLGRNGECYLLANENLAYKEFFTRIGEVIHKKFLFIRLQVLFLIILGLFGEVFKILGINNELFLTNMGIIRTNCFYSGEKAQQEFGLKYHSVRDAVEDSLNWYKDNPV
jgi:dihydroflavonol-4-reductase